MGKACNHFRLQAFEIVIESFSVLYRNIGIDVFTAE